MSAQVSLYGRLGSDPVERTTSTGKLMVTASLAVDVARRDAGEPDTEWFDLVSFGRAAETLLCHRQGDLLAVMGTLTRRRWTGEDGTERTRWSILCDAIISARTVRPGGRKRDSERSSTAETGHAVRVQAPAAEFDDPIPF